MKNFILIIIITTSLFASSLDRYYKQLNIEMDKTSINMRVENKVSLYYLILSTHDKIATMLTTDKANVNLSSLQNLKDATLQIISHLHENNKKISKNNVDKLREFYIQMYQNGMQSIEQKLNNNTTVKPKHKTKALVNNKILYVLLSFIIGFLVGYIIFKKISKKEKKRNSDNTILKELRDQNFSMYETIRDLEEENKKLREQNLNNFKT